MRFSESLQYNIVPEWREGYLNYQALKEKLYALDIKVIQGKLTKEVAIHEFLTQLEKNVNNTQSFYTAKSEELLSNYDELLIYLQNELKLEYETEDKEETDSKDEEDVIHPSSTNHSIITKTSFVEKSLVHDITTPETEEKIFNAKQLIIKNFIDLSELIKFINLNKMGVSKIFKKLDKTLDSDNQGAMENLANDVEMFRNDIIESLQSRVTNLIKNYSDLTNQTIEETENFLQIYLREQVIIERSVIWKDLLKLNDNYKVSTQLKFENFEYWNFSILSINFKLPKFLMNKSFLSFNICLTITLILLFVKTFKDKAQSRCLALLICCAYLWATETIPLFATSLLVPLLSVIFKVLKNDNGEVMSGETASKFILGKMFSSVIMLLLGSFTLAAALTKYNIAKFLSSYILYASGTNPKRVLLAIMGVAMFLSMWISNVAAPVLCFSLIQPILRSIPTDSPIASALVLGIALASNAGGMASPISSPQNVIAMELMDPNPGWGKWFAVSLPVCLFSLFGLWVMLCLMLPFNNQRVKSVKPIKQSFNLSQWLVIFVSIITIVLWCILNQFNEHFGESGIVACVPMIIFFGLGILTVKDLNAFPWNIVILAQGGLALGAAVTSSGLLRTIALGIQTKIINCPFYLIMFIFGLIVLILATFVSHTVAVVIIAPLVKEVGESLPTPRPHILIMTCALLASAAMGLPTSGFPNLSAIGLMDNKGERYVKHAQFVKVGIPGSFICFVVIISLGYGIMVGVFQ